MNAVIVMSGGVGARFGSPIPKQYVRIAGRPVIDYVLDAVDGSARCDRAVIVMDPELIAMSDKIAGEGYDIAPGGSTRIESMYSGLSLLNERYDCGKVVVVDAVAPLITPEIIDDYFDRLDEYDAVITAQKITGGFTDIYDSRLDRENYIITQSPEGFRFRLLFDNYDLNFPYQETAGMLPDGSKRYYNYSFQNNLKLTYGYELEYAEFLLRRIGRIAGDQKK
ncbi:MAG: 2-C-methyl-D-erythritol 4-phosphate cytidylyltransferase [Clostridia bacterium]|nr:2-C-methyl-D-erythritol 4-phosphate cytidylyltransferase [Clostridia bacterium]